MKRFLFCVLFLLFSLSLRAQEYVSDDYEFALYLIDNSYKSDAFTLAFETNYVPSDTLDYLKGWVAYSSEKLDSARTFLSRISPASAFYEKALFYYVVCNLHLGDLSRAESILNSYDGSKRELKKMELAGTAFLREDFAAFDSLSRSFSYSPYQLSESERNLVGINEDRISYKPRLAPEYRRKVVLSFLASAALAGMTAECWVKKGGSHWETIALATTGGIMLGKSFYDWYIGISLSNQKFKDGQKTAVLYNLHIPLRTYFK